MKCVKYDNVIYNLNYVEFIGIKIEENKTCHVRFFPYPCAKKGFKFKLEAQQELDLIMKEIQEF